MTGVVTREGTIRINTTLVPELAWEHLPMAMHRRERGSRVGSRRVRSIRQARRLVALAVGQPPSRRLVLTHALDDLADALVTLSLAGSLFFSLSLEASRSRILLYLILTLAPLAGIAPVFGVVVERTRAGYRTIIVASHITRAALALTLVGSLRSLAFYPLTFGILLSRKGYSIAKTAIVGQLVGDADDLVRTNARLSRVGTIGGAVGFAIGGSLLAAGDARSLLLVAGAVYIGAALCALRVPVLDTRPELNAVAAQAETPIAPAVRMATSAAAVTKAAVGAITFLLAFALKREGADKWVFAAAIVAGGVGGFLGTFLAPILHRVLSEDRMIVLALTVPGIVTTLGVLTSGPFATIAMATTVGVGASVASRAVESLYGRSVSTLARGRIVARSELQFQTAQIIGAAFPVIAAPGTRVGFAVVAGVLLVGGFAYGARVRVSFRVEAGRALLGDPGPARHLALPWALMGEADRLAGMGADRMAVVVAASAVRVLEERGQLRSGSPTASNWARHEVEVQAVIRADTMPDRALTLALLGAARKTIESILTGVQQGVHGEQPEAPEISG